MSVLKLEFPIKTPLLESFLELDQGLLDAIPIGIYACDVDGHILRVNRRASELWGRAPRLRDPAQRFCGSFRVEGLDGRFIPPDQTPMARAVLAGESFEGVEAVVQNPDGKRWVARVNVAPLLDADGEVVGAINCFQDVTREHEMRFALERQQRTFDLAMIASRMGTWRYTMADNICVYDENAQQLYGLTEARFLHDNEGVKAKFHPDDMDHMWARVAKALDPEGDGKYDVEYRVKQLDGSWRWLSAWGLVEFEGEGAGRKPVAIAGASRDLTELKRAEETQRLLVAELNHRVKNTLATVQAIAAQTLRYSADPAEFATNFSGRIQALAQAHSLLSDGVWRGTDLAELIRDQLRLGSLDEARVTTSGPEVRLPPQLALHLALILHELGTNARKYGALSVAQGEVVLEWTMSDKALSLRWVERGGPAVSMPKKLGFGTTLIEQSAKAEGGTAHVSYPREGIAWNITLALAEASAVSPASLQDAPVRQAGLSRAAVRQPPAGLIGQRLLIVEDEPLVALVLAGALEDAGATIVGTAASVDEALRSIETEAIDAVILDRNLRGRAVDGVVSVLTGRGIPFLFVSGYGSEGMPPQFGDAPVLGKPFTQAQLLRAVGEMIAPKAAAAGTDWAALPG